MLALICWRVSRILTFSGAGVGMACGCFCFDLLICLLKYCGDFLECGSFDRDFVGFCFA